MKYVILRIEGMHCDGCAETVKALVECQPGVKSAAVAFASGEARILYDPTTIDEERLVEVAQRPGYRVTAHAPRSGPDS